MKGNKEILEQLEHCFLISDWLALVSCTTRDQEEEAAL